MPGTSVKDMRNVQAMPLRPSGLGIAGPGAAASGWAAHRPRQAILELSADCLRSLGEEVIARWAGDGQAIRLEVEVSGQCPALLVDPVLAVAQAFVGNALTYGMHIRLAGRIAIKVTTADGWTTLCVSDDGWDLRGCRQDGEGMQLAHQVAGLFSGGARLERTTVTRAILSLPIPRSTTQPRYSAR